MEAHDAGDVFSSSAYASHPEVVGEALVTPASGEFPRATLLSSRDEESASFGKSSKAAVVPPAPTVCKQKDGDAQLFKQFTRLLGRAIHHFVLQVPDSDFWSRQWCEDFTYVWQRILFDEDVWRALQIAYLVPVPNPDERDEQIERRNFWVTSKDLIHGPDALQITCTLPLQLRLLLLRVFARLPYSERPRYISVKVDRDDPDVGHESHKPQRWIQLTDDALMMLRPLRRSDPTGERTMALIAGPYRLQKQPRR